MRPFVDQMMLFGDHGHPSRPRERTPRARDPLWDALCHVCRLQTSSMTASSRGITNRALKELRDAGASEGDILERGRAYVERFQGTPTPQSLARQWPGLAVRPRAPIQARPAVFEPLSPEERSQIAQRMRAILEDRA